MVLCFADGVVALLDDVGRLIVFVVALEAFGSRYCALVSAVEVLAYLFSAKSTQEGGFVLLCVFVSDAGIRAVRVVHRSVGPSP